MARKRKKQTGSKPVVATTHDDKRSNIPTADAEDFVAPEVEAPKKVRWERDHTLDPQLVWKGKDTEADVLEADAPPLYIQEKIDPRVLIENLRRSARNGGAEPAMTLFDDFDGLGELDALEHYQHDANWSNRMILGDSLNVMASLAERERLRGKVQMIYIDPPYGIKFGSNWQVSARKRNVKDGKLTDASREVEQIKAFRDTWELGINSYLSYLRDRLLAARDLLTESGSCFVQIGAENAHLVRSLMDEVFGSDNFVSLVAFRKTTGKASGILDNTFDVILWYARSKDQIKSRSLYLDRSPADDYNLRYIELEDGTRRRLSRDEVIDPSLLPKKSRIFRPSPLTSQTPSETISYQVEFQGRTYNPGTRGWSTNAEGMERLRLANRLTAGGKTLSFVRYLDDFRVKPINDIWDDTRQSGFGDKKIYVVQTNARVIERCVLLTTDPGDLILDPTCGSGTTAYVSEKLGRRWITIDTSRVSLALARQRLMGARYPYYLLADSPEGRVKEGQLTGTPLPDATPTNDIRHGFVYERVPHVTLKSIANNPDIREGMTREQIDEAIEKHAPVEMLYDRPYESKDKVRVTGPFTVESLSPHRSLAFAGDPAIQDPNQSHAERAAAEDPGGADFHQTILDNLAKAGIQNGRRAERIEIESIEPYPGTAIQAIATRKNGDDDASAGASRIGISLGPQYGTVGALWIKKAAKEAIAAEDIDVLCILGFSFDPGVLGSTVDGAAVTDEDFASVAAERKLGRVPVLLVRMNADLVMGDDLKKTGAGNLFTVFGEPDIKIRVARADDYSGDEPADADDQIVVDLLGVDVYDPQTGEVRSRDTDRIALWMIDSDYDEESFFVRHAYFTGGQDPYKKLKRDLKADIDPDAWASLYRTTSCPFPKPSTGKIAVKVINDYGDEVLQVFDVALEAE